MMKMPNTDAAIMPPNTGVPTAWRVNAPAPPAKTRGTSRLLKKGRLPLTLNCESDSYANKGMAGGIDARFGYADG